MSLADDLLLQARHLAELDPHRPKQANLRRASSSAYYEFFHLLVADAVQRMVPGKPPGLKARVSRAFQHGEMKEACILFRANPTSAKLLQVLGSPVSAPLRAVARSFIELQEQRHHADYDLANGSSRSEALRTVADAETAFRLWRSVRNSAEANVFLAALVFGKRWDR
jgi:hypothetical protein